MRNVAMMHSHGEQQPTRHKSACNSNEVYWVRICTLTIFRKEIPQHWKTQSKEIHEWDRFGKFFQTNCKWTSELFKNKIFDALKELHQFEKKHNS